MVTWATRTKHIARCLAVAAMSRAARTALFLPGGSLFCVRQALFSGLINLNTYNYYVERLPAIAKQIAANSRKCGFRKELLCRQELADINLEFLLQGRTLDYTYLDLCTSLNQQLASWLHLDFPQHVTPAGTVAITLLRQPRNERFLLTMANILNNTGYGDRILTSSRRMIQRARCVGNTEWVRYPGVAEHPHPRRFSFPGDEELSPRFHESSVRLLSVLRLLWSHYRFDLDACVEYKRDASTSSGSRMVTFRFTGFRYTGRPLYHLRDWNPRVLVGYEF